MNKVARLIPNFITTLNMFCGFTAIVLAFDSKTLSLAPWFIVMAATFDFIDGFAARILKAYSDFGKQLDSLADLLSFGVAPGVLLYNMLSFTNFSNPLHFDTDIVFIVAAALIPVFSALRLAKFNLDARQTDSFIGLPTPASAIFIASLVLAFFHSPLSYVQQITSNAYFLLSVSVFLAFLMICELPMFSLKMKKLSFSKYYVQFLFLGTSLVLLLILQITAISFIILLYILLSVIIFIFKRLQ